jgi:crossover junction endodeoxyribonuclease RusA
LTASIAFTVHGEAQPKGSSRAFVPKGWTRAVVTSDNPKLKSWEHTIRERLQTVMAETDPATLAALFDGPVHVGLVFHRTRPKSAPKRVTAPTTKPDLDKLARGAIDALSGVLFHDDAQVTEITARKVFAERGALVEIVVTRAS